MNRPLMERHLSAYFAGGGIWHLEAARVAQHANEPKAQTRAEIDATFVLLLTKTPNKQMARNKLLATSKLSQQWLSSAVSRGLLTMHFDGVIRWVRLPGVDYSAIDNAVKSAKFGRVVAASQK